MDINTDEILEHLQEFSLTAETEVLHRMKMLCVSYHLTAEDVVDQWVAFSTSLKNCVPPTMSMLDRMEKEELMKAKNAKNRKSYSSVTAPVYNKRTIDDFSTDVSESSEKDNRSNAYSVNGSPIFSPGSITPTCFTPSKKYSSRTGSGDVVCSFGETANASWKLTDEFNCDLLPFNKTVTLQAPYYYMCEKLRQTASILNDMIQEASELFSKEHNIDNWGHIQLPSVETVPVIGRICSDSVGKLNAASLLLQGSLEMSSGRTIPLDVSRLEKYSFFPGQIISGTGVNSLGHKFVMHDLYENILPPLKAKAPHLSNCFDSLSVVIASGPFATSDTLSYDPLWDLMKYVQAHQPHVLILIGPFVDVKNPMIETMNKTFEDVFKEVISKILKQTDQINTKIVLVPSTKDAHHHFIYPTPPYSVDHHTKRLYLASDPCVLDIEGVIFAITSTDILFHLGKEEISFGQMPDRLGRICSHILTQRNFYPLYPPNEEVNIDFLHYESHAGLPVFPHVLIVPSDFRYFVKDIHGCCCVNPERLTKHSSGGTFVRLKVCPINRDKYDGSIIESIQAQVVKI